MWPFRKRVVTDVDPLLVARIADIAEVKKALPFNQRGWINELGLHVQLRELAGVARLEAGSRGAMSATLDAWREDPFGDWEVKKYERGDWERLVEPTLRLAEWIYSQGGLNVDIEPMYRSAVSQFEATGTFDLPPPEPTRHQD